VIGEIMKIINRIFMMFGIVFVGYIAAAIYLDSVSSRFQKDNLKFVVNFMHEFSADWSIENVESKIGVQLIKKADTESGRVTLRNFRSLGGLKSISKIELIDHVYFLNDQPNVGVFALDAVFEHGRALVKLVIEDTNKGIKVKDINMIPVYVETNTEVQPSSA